MNTIPPRYYMPGEVRAMRDADRRRYRNSVMWLVFYQILVVGPIRYSLDLLLDNPKFSKMLVIEPYILPSIIVLVVLIWLLGLPNAFRRRY